MPEIEIELPEISEELSPFRGDISSAGESSAAIQEEIEALKDNQKEDFANALETIKNGEVPENPGVKEQYDKIMSKLKETGKSLSEFMSKYLQREVVIDPAKPFDQQTPETQQAVLDSLNKMTGGDPQAFQKFVDALKTDNVAVDAAKNPEKYTAYQRAKEAILIIGGLSGVVGGIIKMAFLKKMLDKVANDMSGCTRYQAGNSGTEILKSCNKDKSLPSACNCPGDFDKLKSLCSEIKDDETCVNGWNYKYIELTWLDALSAIFNGIVNAAAATTEGGLSILKFFTKYGLYVALGLLLLFLLPQIIKIMSTIPKRNGPPAVT